MWLGLMEKLFLLEDGLGSFSLNGAEALALIQSEPDWAEVRIPASEGASNMQVVVFPQPCHLDICSQCPYY
jgi:hypothetical protein